MAKKIKKKKKGGAKKKKSSLQRLMEELGKAYVPPPEEVFRSVENKWVHVHVRLLNWSYMNFELKLLETTPLYIIQQKIMERHSGSVQELSMWKDGVAPHLKLKDMNKTLNQVFHFDSSTIFVPQEKKKPVEMTEEKDETTDATEKRELNLKETQDAEEGDGEDDGEGREDEDDEDDDEEAQESGSESEGDEDLSFAMESGEGCHGIEHECIIYYDFEPLKTDCPLLLVEPRLVSVLDKK